MDHHASLELWRPSAHEEQGWQLHWNEVSRDHQPGFVSIVLSGGAELAEFTQRCPLPLFSGDGCGNHLVELRRKSGICVEEALSSMVTTAAPPRDEDGEDDHTKLRFSFTTSPIVLKSMGVIQEERRRSKSSAAAATAAKKPRAVSMDETALSRLQDVHYARKKLSSVDDVGSKSNRVAVAAPLPLPLPPPPGDPARNNFYDDCLDQRRRHRRHPRNLSIDLRASPAAKFVVQVMPWELASSSSSSSPSSSLDDCSSSSRRSIGSHCFVPFKWEEAPGKPKRYGIHEDVETVAARGGGGGSGSGAASMGSKLQLPPRLQHQQSSSLQRSSPTSTLDRDKETSSSSASSPRIDASSGSSAFPGEGSPVGAGDQTPRWIRALLTLQVWDTAVRAISRSRGSGEEKEDLHEGFPENFAPSSTTKKMKNPSSWPSRKNTGEPSVPYPSWSPAPLPRSSWLFHRSRGSSGTTTLGKIAWKSCNAVKRAVKFRWWSSSSSSRSKGFYNIGKKRKSRSIYQPLLCPVDGDASAFGCSA